MPVELGAGESIGTLVLRAAILAATRLPAMFVPTAGATRNAEKAQKIRERSRT
jgi:hypothetical protein